MFLILSDDINLPSELRLFSYGENQTRKGTLIFDEQSAKECMEAYSTHGAELPFDWDHAMLERGVRDPKVAGEAAGWFNLELKNDGLWATNIRFTDDAAQAIRNKKWRYFSPAVLCDKKKRVTRVINVALTNLPATDKMEPLVTKDEPTSEGKENNLMKDTICVTLGLNDDLSEADVVKHIVSLTNHYQELCTLTGKTAFDDVLGTLQAWRSGYEQNMKKQEEIERLTALKAAADKKALLEANKAKFSPSLREWANEQSLETLTSFVASAPDLVTLNEQAPVEAPKPLLSDVERRVIKSFGINEEDFLATKNAKR